MRESDVDDVEEFDSSEFDHYTAALLFGGPPRVVQVAVFLLDEQRRIRISRGTRRVEVLRREPPGPEREEDPLREAVLAEIPDTGFRLREVIAAAVRSPEVLAVGEAMREEGLVRGRRLRPTRDGRALCRTLVEEMGDSQVGRLAVLGPRGLAKSQIQTVLMTDDPKPVKFRRGRLRGHGLHIRGMPALLDGNDSGYSGGDFGGGGGDSGGGGGF